MHSQEAAKFLFDHRLNKSNINDLPDHLMPKNDDEAYLIQEELKLLYLSLKENISIGKKVGCTSIEGQKQLDINEPFYGNLFSRYSSIEPKELSSKKFIPNLSIIDLLANFGSDSKKFVKEEFLKYN